jgi:DNA-directed DNA polymerase III PolC
MFSLHAHSNYSLLEGTITIDNLISFAKNNGSNFVSLADTNGMYGLIQLAKRAKENKIKPVLGAYIDEPGNKNIYAIILAKNNNGYIELCKIITSRKLKEDFSLFHLLRQNLNNIFILTSSIELLEDEQIFENNRENLFVELIVTEKKKKNTRALYELAQKKGLQIIASHPAYFEKPENHLLHKVVTAIKQNSTIANLSDDSFADEEFCLKPTDDFKKTWKSLPEALWNIEHIVQNCNVDLDIGSYKFPVFNLPNNETSFSYLWKIAFEGLGERYKPITDKAVKRLQYELEVIDELGFCDYFLIIWDITRQVKNREMMMIGRGSAANSLVAYCLGFTQVDPIKHNLYFERFLNRGRTSPPDVDLDFSWRERDEIVKYIYEKYGYERVAMICTTVTFRARSAFREVAKVFGIPDSEISKYSKFIPWTSAYNLPHLAEKFPESKSLKLQTEPWKTIISIASQLAGFPRHLGIHASGLVITQNPITNYVAVEYAKNKGLGLIVTQPDMYSIEDMGLVKIDLLSQRSLGVLRDTMKRIEGKKKAKETKPQIFTIN